MVGGFVPARAREIPQPDQNSHIAFQDAPGREIIGVWYDSIFEPRTLTYIVLTFTITT